MGLFLVDSNLLVATSHQATRLATIDNELVTELLW